MEANNILFRCSSLGHLMTEPKSKSEVISEGTKTHLIDVFISYQYGRREEIDSKFIRKGHAREEDCITLLARTDKRMYKKNDSRLNNDFVTGEPDLFIGEKIYAADETLDTKTSWSMHTFYRSMHKPLDKSYYWQGQGYMWLTGAKKHTVVYGLVNNTVQGILDEIRRISYKPGMMDEYGNESDLFIEKKRQIEINSIFDREEFERELELTNQYYDFTIPKSEWKYNVPISERIFKFEFNRNDSDIERLQQRITDCREWMEINLFNKQTK